MTFKFGFKSAGHLRALSKVLLCSAVAVLAACGGGGGDAGQPPFGGGGPAVDRLSLVLTNSTGAPVAKLSNSGTERITATVTALDSNNAVVPNAVVSFVVNQNAEVASSGTATDSGGKLVGLVGIGADRSSRKVTVTAKAGTGGKSVSADFLVTGATLKATTPPNAVPGQQIIASYSLADSSGNAMVGETVTLTGNGTEVEKLVTDSLGVVEFKLNAPTQQGLFTLVATAAGETKSNDVDVRASTVDPAVGVITGASVSANPSVVSVNTSENPKFNGTTVRALFKGAANAPVKNVRVWFTLPDPNSVGGIFSDNAKSLVYSDSTGIATTTYYPASVSSPTDGVIVLACYSNVDFTIPTTPGVCPVRASDGTLVQSKTATLTVVDQALRIDIGTDEVIGLADVTYTKDFVVVVVDAAGLAKADVEITPKLDLVAFYKGYYDFDGESWVRSPPSRDFGKLQLPACLNEDTNRSGFLEEGEDTNGNNRLDPGGVTIKMLNATKTDASGKAIVRIEYPRDRATWIDYVITVTGRVGGSEGVAVYQGTRGGLGNLPAPGDVVKKKDTAPAFAISPYGRGPGCDNTN